MWRGEFTALDFAAHDEGGSVMTDGALAIGAGDMDCPPRELDIVQELADPFQARLDHGRGDREREL